MLSTQCVALYKACKPKPKLGCDLCDLDLWPLTLTFCMDLTLGDNPWKFHDDTMMGT